jgi:hypothetical protein
MGGIILHPKERWQHRAVKETGGNTTLMGCFVLAILGFQHGRKPPRFGSHAAINEDGMVIAHAQNADGKMFKNENLGHVQNVIDSFRGLADRLKLADWERDEMFSELRKWFVHDARANESSNERGLLQ